MRNLHYWLLALGLSGVFVIPIGAQEEELEIIDAVTKYQEQLNADEVSKRESAEKSLIKMGPKILEYLDPVTEDATTDFRERVTRIRTTLEKITANNAANATKITLKGKMTIGDALSKIKKRTGNNVVIQNVAVADTEIELDLKEAEFWAAMEKIMQAGKLTVDRYGSEEPGQLALAPLDQNANVSKIPVAHSKIFQTQVLRIDSSVNLENPQLDFTTVNLLVRWEPRLRPISVDIPMSRVKVVDEFGDVVKIANPEEVIYGMVQPEIPEVEFSLTLPRVDRQIEALNSISARIDTILPGRVETFRMKKVSKLKPGFTQKKAGANLTFGGTRKNDDVYSVKLSISFDEENNALESHQGWVFQNEVYLQDSQGNREDAISLETIQQDNEMVTVQYYFVTEPGDRTLVYRTPASIVKLPVDLELTRIPLP